MEKKLDHSRWDHQEKMIVQLDFQILRTMQLLFSSILKFLKLDLAFQFSKS